MATAKLKSKKPAAKKHPDVTVKRAYRRKIKGAIPVPSAVPIESGLDFQSPYVSVVEETRQELQDEREEHNKTRLRLAAVTGIIDLLQHQLDAVRHTVSQTIVVAEEGPQTHLEFSPIRTRADRLPRR